MAGLIVQMIKWIFLWGILFGIIGWLGWMAYVMLRKSIFSDKSMIWFKFTILRKKIDERDIKWCADAVEKGWNEFQVRKFLLTHNVLDSKVEELAFIFNKVKNTLKGGIK